MKKALFAITISLALAACGDNSSSNADDNSGYSISNDGNRITTTGPLFVDETQQIIAITQDAKTNDVCVQENDSWIWKSVSIPSETDSYKYEFRGDSLLLYRMYSDTSTSNYASIYIGKSGGKIYQTWAFTQCEYDKEEDSTDCYERNLKYISESITFSPGKYSSVTDLFPDQFYADQPSINYMNSFFMDELYKALNLDEANLDAGNILREKKEAGIPEKCGINIIENSRMSQTFTSGGKQYTVAVKKIERTFLQGTIDNDISIDVTDGETTCNNFYKVVWITEREKCSEEYSTLFYKDKITDINGNEITMTSVYRDYNHYEFNNCIRGIAAKNSELVNSSALSRKATARHEPIYKKTDSGVNVFSPF